MHVHRNILKNLWNTPVKDPQKSLTVVFNSIQKPWSEEIDFSYFHLLNEGHVDYNLNLKVIKNRFYQLQGLCHPDKVSNMNDVSSWITDAYKTLSRPFDRAEYICKLGGECGESTAMDQEFLLEIMNARENGREIVNDYDEIFSKAWNSKSDSGKLYEIVQKWRFSR